MSHGRPLKKHSQKDQAGTAKAQKAHEEALSFSDSHIFPPAVTDCQKQQEPEQEHHKHGGLDLHPPQLVAHKRFQIKAALVQHRIHQHVNKLQRILQKISQRITSQVLRAPAGADHAGRLCRPDDPRYHPDMLHDKNQRRNQKERSHGQIFPPPVPKACIRDQKGQKTQRQVAAALAVHQEPCHKGKKRHALPRHGLLFIDGLQAQAAVKEQKPVHHGIVGEGGTLLHIDRQKCQNKQRHLPERQPPHPRSGQQRKYKKIHIPGQKKHGNRPPGQKPRSAHAQHRRRIQEQASLDVAVDLCLHHGAVLHLCKQPVINIPVIAKRRGRGKLRPGVVHTHEAGRIPRTFISKEDIAVPVRHIYVLCLVRHHLRSQHYVVDQAAEQECHEQNIFQPRAPDEGQIPEQTHKSFHAQEQKEEEPFQENIKIQVRIDTEPFFAGHDRKAAVPQSGREGQGDLILMIRHPLLGILKQKPCIFSGDELRCRYPGLAQYL